MKKLLLTLALLALPLAGMSDAGTPMGRNAITFGTGCSSWISCFNPTDLNALLGHWANTLGNLLIHTQQSNGINSNGIDWQLDQITYSVKAFGAKCDGSTDDATAFNNALTAVETAGGGIVFVPGGTCIVGSTINLPSGTTQPLTFRGTGVDSTTIKLKNAANTDVVSVTGFASLTGTSSTAGVYRGIAIEDMTIDGNKANQTTGGYGIRLYGKGYTIKNVNVQNAFNDGLYTEYGGADSFSLPANELEAKFINITSSFNSGNGVTQKGPHDSIFTSIVAYSNGAWGWEVALPARGSHVNTYLNTSGGIWVHGTGAIDGADIVGSTATGWGALLDTGTGACLMAPSSFGGPIALEIRSTNHVIAGTVANSTTAGVKFGTGSGNSNLQLSMTNNTGYWFDVASAGNSSTVAAVSQDTSGTLFNGSPAGSWFVQGGNAAHSLFQTSSSTRVVKAGGWSPILPASNSNVLADDTNNTLTGTQTFSASIAINGGATSSGSGNLNFGSGTGTLTAPTGGVKSIHFIGNSGTPTTSAGAGAGTGPTITLTGNDAAGIVGVTTGTTPSASAVVVQVFFATTYGSAPNCVISPDSAGSASSLSGNGAVVIGGLATDHFNLNVGSAALSASTLYKWHYVCIQ